MDARFIHCADVHLGNHQYQNDTRYNDFARAFHYIVDDAIARQAQALLIAGDLFHKRAIDALTLFQAKAAFSRLKDAGIPAIIIEGNHDRAYYREAGVSWLSFLSWTDDVILLAPEVGNGEFRFAPWSAEAHNGGYYDIPNTGVRIYGVPWYGASTGAVMAQVAAELRRVREEEAAQGVRFRVLMLHTGVEGQVPNMHGLPTPMQFAPLKDVVDYIALGHVHKPYEMDNLIFNPGSTETASAEEAHWKRGYYVVDVGASGFTAQHTLNPQRGFLRWSFPVDGLTTPDDLRVKFTAFVRDHQENAIRAASRYARELPQDDPAANYGPVVDIALTGTLAFDQSALDKRELEGITREHMQPLVAIIRNYTESFDFAPETRELDGRDRATRQELELTVFRDLLLRDARYAPQAGEWAKVVAELKQKGLDNDDPAVIAGWLSQQRQRLAGSGGQ